MNRSIKLIDKEQEYTMNEKTNSWKCVFFKKHT